MFKEVKKISSNQSQINDQLALRKIYEKCRKSKDTSIKILLGIIFF